MVTEKGAVAESKIAHWLSKNNWRILRRNYRKHGFEIDIIALKERVLLAGEVKARTFLDEQRIPEILKRNQIRRIKKGMENFIAENDLEYESIRLDLFIVHGKYLNKLARYEDIELS